MVRLGQVERPAVEIDDLATPGGRCPACGQPLFAWIEVDGAVGGAMLSHVLDRCENCKLAIERGDGGEALGDEIEEVRRRVAADGEAAMTTPNGTSWQAGAGAESWAGLRPASSPVVLNPKALGLLLEHEGLAVDSISHPAMTGMALLMQTMLNLVTFNRDFATRVLAGELKPAQARHGGLGYGVDALTTTLTAIPVAALAVIFESAALLARRGGIMRAKITRR